MLKLSPSLTTTCLHLRIFGFESNSTICSCLGTYRFAMPSADPFCGLASGLPEKQAVEHLKRAAVSVCPLNRAGSCLSKLLENREQLPQRATKPNTNPSSSLRQPNYRNQTVTEALPPVAAQRAPHTEGTRAPHFTFSSRK
ncbi:unnamed protein product [Eretmochelys imbricata]